MEKNKKEKEDIILRLFRRQSYYKPTKPKEEEDSIFSSFDIFLDGLLRLSSDGEAIDAAIEGMWLPLLKPKSQIIQIKMPSYKSFKIMAKKAFFIIYTYNKGEVYFEAAYFNRKEEFPPRSYIYITDARNFNSIINDMISSDLNIIPKNEPTANILKIKNKNVKFSMDKVITKFREFKRKINEINNSENSQKQWEIINRISLEQWKDGDAGKLFIFEDNRCVVCNSEESLMNLDHKIVAGDLKITIVLPICFKCHQESLKYPSTIEFIRRIIKKRLSDETESEVPKTFNLERADYFGYVIQRLNERKEVKKARKDEKEEDKLRVDLINNCELILRLTDVNDYGYMFFKEGKQIIRWDSAPHHIKKTRIGPDHIHQNLIKKEDPKVSLATGSVLFDIDLMFRNIKPYLYNICRK